MQPILMQKRSMFARYQNPGLASSISSLLRDCSERFSLPNIALVEADSAQLSRVHMLAGYITDGEDSLVAQFRAAMGVPALLGKSHFCNPVPAFDDRRHYLWTECVPDRADGVLREHLDTVSRRLSHCLEYYVVTDLMVELNTAVDAESLVSLYAHHQRNMFGGIRMNLMALQYVNSIPGQTVKVDLHETNELLTRMESVVRHMSESLENLCTVVSRRYDLVSVRTIMQDMASAASLLGLGDLIEIALSEPVSGCQVCRAAKMILTTLLQNSKDAMMEARYDWLGLGAAAGSEAAKPWRPAVSLAVLQDTARGEIVINHSDNGPGMSKELLDSLFSPFASTKGPGRGLGLYLSRRLAESLGGALDLEYSEPDRGTRFVLRLPYRSAAG